MPSEVHAPLKAPFETAPPEPTGLAAVAGLGVPDSTGLAPVGAEEAEVASVVGDAAAEDAGPVVMKTPPGALTAADDDAMGVEVT